VANITLACSTPTKAYWSRLKVAKASPRDSTALLSKRLRGY